MQPRPQSFVVQVLHTPDGVRMVVEMPEGTMLCNEPADLWAALCGKQNAESIAYAGAYVVRSMRSKEVLRYERNEVVKERERSKQLQLLAAL